MSYFVGVDGGGTRTTVVLADDTGAELRRVTGPASLVDAAEPAASARVVARIVRGVVVDAGLALPVTALCVGLAGAGQVSPRAVVQEALEAAGLAQRVAVVTDGHLAVHGALGERPGLLLLAGTGSIAYAKAADATIHRCGGWGTVLGDEGSAYSIGRAALRAALRAVDGRGPVTTLLGALLAETSSDTPRDLPAWVGRVTKAEVATLARVLVDEARHGDVVAKRILEDGAYALACHLPPLLAWLREQRGGRASPPIPLVFHGGMFRFPSYKTLVWSAVEDLVPGVVALQEAEADAATGAVRLAQSL
ncbi:MAG: BadF/BadG/BcrA/BcrD ATPase family protein [Bacteroidota bacterium]